MEIQALAAALQSILPIAVPVRDYELAKNPKGQGYIKRWGLVATPQPSQDALATAARSIADAEAIRLQLVADLKTLPLGVQVFFKATADTLRDLLSVGQVAIAKEIIATTPLPSVELETARDAMLSRFP